MLELVRAGANPGGAAAPLRDLAPIPGDRTALLAAALHRVARCAARSVLLWSHRESTALTSAVLTCRDAGARVLVGGPGWDAVLLPTGTERVPTLTAAVESLR